VPGREHDTTALREHSEILPLLTTWTAEQLRVLGDLGYEGEADTITVAFKKPQNGELSNIQKTINKVHNRVRAVGKRGNSLLKTTLKALRNVSLSLEDQEDRRGRSRAPGFRTRPHHLITHVRSRLVAVGDVERFGMQGHAALISRAPVR
jgi:DDE superfamily endonuclease